MSSARKILATLIFISPAIAIAEWISLGDNPINGELDKSSIVRHGDLIEARNRIIFTQPDATYTLTQNLAINCDKYNIEILSGFIASDQSTKISKMPSLSHEERTIQIPAKTKITIDYSIIFAGIKYIKA